MHVRSSSSRSPLVEQLEARTLLSGNVTAFVSAGSLTIIGDAGDNAITIDESAGAGTLTITGTGTTVNGDVVPVTFSGVTRDIKALLDGGNDSITVTGVTATRNVLIDNGEGDNTTSLTDVTIPGKLTIRNGTGADTVTGAGMNVGLATSITNGAGANDTTLGGTFGALTITGLRDSNTVTVDTATINGNVSIATKGGISNLTTIDTTAARNFTHSTGAGDHTVTMTDTIVTGTTKITHKTGDTITSVTNSQFGVGVVGQPRSLRNFSMSTGTGTATTTFDGTIFGKNMTATFGKGGTTTTVTNGTTVAGNMKFAARNGVDILNIVNTTVTGRTNIATGEGEDVVSIDNSTFTGATAINTGSEADLLNVETVAAPVGVPTTTTFGDLSVNMASESDTMTIGITGGVDNLTVLNGKTTLNGGQTRAPNTLFVNEDTTTTLVTPVIRNFDVIPL